MGAAPSVILRMCSKTLAWRDGRPVVVPVYGPSSALIALAVATPSRRNREWRNNERMARIVAKIIYLSSAAAICISCNAPMLASPSESGTTAHIHSAKWRPGNHLFSVLS